MRALALKSADGLDAVSFETMEAPQPGRGEVRVALKAAALNHRELWIIKGQYPGMQLPTTLGADGAGVVEAVGDGVDGSLVGQHVVLYPGLGWGDDPRYPAQQFGLLGMPGPGTIAEQITVAADSIVPKPPHLDFNAAAAVPLAGLTAWRGLVTKAQLKPGEKLLVTGAGGGVATFAIAFGVALGAEVYVTSGSDATLQQAQKLGAKAGFNYKDEGWRKALPKASGGLDVVFDGAPTSGYANYGRALKMGARVVVYGSTGGMSFPVNAPELFLKNVSIIGTNVGNLAEFRAMLNFVAEKKLQPVIDRTFPFDQAKEALAYLRDSHAFGKVTIAI
ncbi:MAG: zinc-binding dehydrogenase [Alphaproteobacteria bacterium]|nr:zinc-binding dehydrogenase [Alphaproteobacteria bacterium]